MWTPICHQRRMWCSSFQSPWQGESSQTTLCPNALWSVPERVPHLLETQSAFDLFCQMSAYAARQETQVDTCTWHRLHHRGRAQCRAWWTSSPSSSTRSHGWSGPLGRRRGLWPGHYRRALHGPFGARFDGGVWESSSRCCQAPCCFLGNLLDKPFSISGNVQWWGCASA